jgi:hypothetical protein
MKDWPYYEVRAVNVADEKRVVFEDFQRPAIPWHVERIRETYDPMAVGVCTFAEMEEPGMLSINDGGQRVRAVRQRFEGRRTIYLPAAIIVGKNYEERAALFAMIDHRVALTEYDRYVADLARLDSNALSVKRVVGIAQLQIVPSGRKQPTDVRCVGALRTSVKKYGEDAFERALRMAARWAKQTSEQVRGDVVVGLTAHLAQNHGRDAELESLLRGWTMHDAWLYARRGRLSAGGSGGARTFLQRYFGELADGRITRSEGYELSEVLQASVSNGRTVITA